MERGRESIEKTEERGWSGGGEENSGKAVRRQREKREHIRKVRDVGVYREEQDEETEDRGQEWRNHKTRRG